MAVKWARPCSVDTLRAITRHSCVPLAKNE
jgi:hypothetical protein